MPVRVLDPEHRALVQRVGDHARDRGGGATGREVGHLAGGHQVGVGHHAHQLAQGRGGVGVQRGAGQPVQPDGDRDRLARRNIESAAHGSTLRPAKLIEQAFDVILCAGW
ncbi:hypothetical protein RB614_01595 [Phytohabitans sp. ZYX-F-186]|uniref:Uncharacterized protein n=1 Tax=Phytohabitans maris TaxID=3071409 RepID=A0ABU0ZA52_9ACTN|nr:hypothetical protein [Phytohabitans sp. ZYX-F-186]MDQ7903212.1 hypothetical protein [Phytohabitans sp. ZYX-F-186]